MIDRLEIELTNCTKMRCILLLTRCSICHDGDALEADGKLHQQLIEPTDTIGVKACEIKHDSVHVWPVPAEAEVLEELAADLQNLEADPPPLP